MRSLRGLVLHASGHELGQVGEGTDELFIPIHQGKVGNDMINNEVHQIKHIRAFIKQFFQYVKEWEAVAMVDVVKHVPVELMQQLMEKKEEDRIAATHSHD